jgi:hypothetical protein
VTYALTGQLIGRTAMAACAAHNICSANLIRNDSLAAAFDAMA